MDKNDVIIGITADATGVEAGVKRSKRSLADLGKSAQEASQGVGKLGDGGDKAAKKIARDTKTMERSLQQWLAKLEAGSKDSRVYWERMADFKGIDKNALRPLLNQLDEWKRKQQEAAGASGGLISSLGGLRAAASVAIGGFAVQGLLVATRAMYDASAAAERLRIGLDFASARGSAQEIAYLRNTTHDLGLAFQSTAQSYMQFQAAAKGTTLEGQKARAVFESVAKASAVMGLSAEQNSGVLLALQQMVSKGTVQAEELRGQLGERLPGAFQIAARSMGVTTAELGKMLEMGQVISADFLPKFAAELEKSLGDAPEKAANRLDASINRYNNALEHFKQSIGDTGVSKFWAGQMDILSDGLMNFNQSIEKARASGAGFGGQLLAAAGAALEFVNPINAISYSALEAGQKLKDAEQRLKELKESGAKSSSNLMLRESYNHAQRLVDKLREAKAVQDALAGISTPSVSEGLRDKEAGNSRGNRANYEKAFWDSQQWLAERNDGITKQFAADLDGLAKAYANGALSVSEYAKAVTELNKKRFESTEAGKAEAKAAKDGAKGNKEGESAILSYIKSLEARTAAQRLEIAQGDKLTESQRARIQLEGILGDAKTKASKSQIAYAQGLLTEAEANEAWLKNASDVEKALADMQKAREQSLQSVQDSVKKLVEEAESAAYAETHNVSLAEAVERLALARAENAYQQAVERQEAPATLDYLRQEIAARKELVAATAQKGVKEANQRAADNAAKAWDRVIEGVGDGFYDAIVTDGATALQALERVAQGVILRPMVQYAANNVAGALGLGSEGSASSLSTAASLVQNGHSIYGALTGSLTYGLGSAAASIGTAIGSTAATSFGAGMAASGFTANAFSTGASLVGSGATSTGLGMMAGAAMPWVAGGLAIASLLGGLDFGGETRSALTTSIDAKGGIHEVDHWVGEHGAFPKQEVQSAVQAAFFDTNKLLKDLGSSTQISAIWSAMETSGKRRGGTFFGGQLNTGEQFGSPQWYDGMYTQSLNFEEALAQYQGQMAQAFIEVFQKSADLPQWVRDQFAGKSGAEGLQAAMQQVAAIDAAFDSLAQTMSMFAGISGSVQTTLLNVSGGIDALSANAQSFYSNFYSEQERLDATVASLTDTFARYGAELPDTTEQYRALVEQQMAAGDAGAEFAAVLLGLNSTFKSVADAWAQEMEGMAGSVTDFFAGLQESIDSLSLDVESTRQSILRGNDVMSAAEIGAAITAASISAPSSAGVAKAGAASTAAAAAFAAAKAQSDRSSANYAAKQQGLSAAQTALSAGNAQKAALQQQAKDLTDWINSLWDGGANSGYSYSKRKRWSDDAAAQLEAVNKQIASMSPGIEALKQDVARQQTIANQAGAVASADASKLALAQAALAAAQKAETQAKAQYAAQMNQFVIDAGNSVSKLSGLRGEVVSFYEAQAQAVEAMLASAGNLRSVVDHLRMGQLTTAQTAQELGQRYAMDYSMALSTSGATRAGYVDSMAGNLGALSEALRAESTSGADWRVQTARLMAQATNAAGLLEGDAEGADYESVSLGLLDSIDGALAALGTTAQSAEQLIVGAINQGTSSTLNGLRAVVAALKGEKVPAFAAGGFHAGGLRLVGERGPELEVTGPARYWSASQTQAMLGGGGGNSERTEKLLAQLIEENRVQAARIVDLQLQQNRLLQRWDAMGMPEEREVTA